MISYKIQCSIVRGGTTKGVYINTAQLPGEQLLRDKIILALFGSPDYRQINGLGGADPLTSKVALISASDNTDVDLYYQSGEVGIDEPSINYSTMCGNLASGVGLFAIDIGMVAVTTPVTHITICNVNTGKIIEASIPIGDDFKPTIQATCETIDGVDSAGVEIDLSFVSPSGSITGRLLPSGKVVNQFEHLGVNYRCSIVDCGTLYALFPAELFGLLGDEAPDVLDSNVAFKETVEVLRNFVAEEITLACNKIYSSKQIKIAIFSPPQCVPEKDVVISARVINRYKTHKAFPVTGAICIGAACIIPGTLLNKLNCLDGKEHTVRIFHPEGVLVANSQCDIVSGEVVIDHVGVKRSAKIIMTGISDVFLMS